MMDGRPTGTAFRAAALFLLWCVAYAAYFKWISSRVPIAVATPFDLVIVPSAFGILAVLALKIIRLRIFVVTLAAFIVPWLFSGPGDPAKPQLRLVALLIMMAVAVIAAIATDFARMRLTRGQQRN